MAKGSKTVESPLISHARMQALYRALVELRALAPFGIPAESLACVVGTAIDLADGDLVGAPGGEHDSVILDHVRAVGRRSGGGAATAADWKRLMKRLAEAQPDPFPGGAFERVLCAAGAAMALKAGGSASAAIVYASHDELSRAEWKRIFPVIGQDGLPLVLVVIPHGESACDLEAISVRAAPGIERAVPVIPVDAGDPVAIYRVAQETMLRARASGGAAVLLGVGCGTDPVELLGRQLVRKGICTGRWVRGVATHLTALIDAVGLKAV